MTPTKMQLALAGATKPCSCPYCLLHRGTPRLKPIYVFGDEVRLACDSQIHAVFTPCKTCQGRGWIPATDGWVWWRAVAPLDIITDVLDEWSYRWRPDIEGGRYDPEVAFFTALTRMVQSHDGWELMEKVSNKAEVD